MADAGPLDVAAREFQRALQRNIKGIGYFASPAPVLGSSAKELLLSRGPLRVYHYHPLVDEVYRVPVLLVMATTNRGYIFDMVPGQSLVEFLLRRGFDVYMVDWEAPGPEERHLALRDYAGTFIDAAIEQVRRTSGESEFSILGYCFGGVLSLIWSALNPDAGLKNLATFTTPVDFSGMPLFQAWSDRRFFDVDRLVDTLGLCPADMLFSAFDMLRPAGRLAANIRLVDNMWNDEFVKSHRMFQRWSTDMLPLAGEYFRETTKKLMWDNQLLHGTLDVDGRRVDLSRITVPFMHVTAEHDHIVPAAASAPLIDLIGSTDKEQVVLKGGHVSLVAGGNAIKRLWPRLEHWLGQRSV